MKYKILTATAVLGTLWHYAPPQFWPLLEVYAGAECVLLIASLLTK
jgi:hypothetical protein